MEISDKKFVAIKKNTYGFGSSFAYAFGKEYKDRYERLHDTMTCKDRIHEGLSNVANNTNMCSATYIKNDSGINMKKLVMILVYGKDLVARCGGKPVLRKNIDLIQNHMNTLEKGQRWRLSQISELSDGTESKDFIIVLEGSKNYLKSTPALHMYLSALRSLVEVPTVIKDFDFKNASENIKKYCKDKGKSVTRIQEVNTLLHVGKERVDKFLFKHHRALFKGLSMKEIYPIKSSAGAGNHHDHFGIQSFCKGKMYVTKVDERVKGLFRKHSMKKCG